MYILKRDNKRFNQKLFTSYEEARKYARRKITEFSGRYFDNIGTAGFSIVRVL